MSLLDVSERLVIAHRGASEEFPENTFLAFREALNQGADALEFDVHLSADGVPVVIHDATLDRTTNGSGPVAGATQRELARLDAGSGEGVPILADVLDEFAATPMVIEIKDPRSTPAVASLVRDRGRAGLTLFGSFRREALLALSPDMNRSASRLETGLFWLAAQVGVLFSRDSFRAFTVPERQGIVQVVGRRFLARSMAGRIPVHVWTVDRPADAQRLWLSGVSGIITNRPQLMVETRDNLNQTGE